MNFDTESANGTDTGPSEHWRNCRHYFVDKNGKAISYIPKGAAVYTDDANTDNKVLESLDEKYQKVLAEIVASRK